MGATNFIRQYATISTPVLFTTNIVMGALVLPKWFEMPEGGDIVFVNAASETESWTGCLPGKIYHGEIRSITSTTARIRVGTDPEQQSAPVVDAAIPMTQFGGIDAGGIGTAGSIYVAFVVAATGAADDVTIHAGLPYGIRITNVRLKVTTAKAGATGTLRTAAAGAGTALSSDLATDAAVAVASTLNTSPTVAAAGALYLRRSDRDFAGHVIVDFIKT